MHPEVQPLLKEFADIVPEGNTTCPTLLPPMRHIQHHIDSLFFSLFLFFLNGASHLTLC